MSAPVYLFLLIPNDSGSTWLQNIISLCSNCVSFKPGLDGKGVVVDTIRDGTVYPIAGDHKATKVFSEKSYLWETPDGWDWEVIKTLWHAAWSENKHYRTASPRVYLEKSPPAVFSSDMYFKQFNNVRFIIMTRNPYAVAEGMRRTMHRALAPDDIAGREIYSMERCTKHWIRCAKRQIYNYATYKDIAIEITYEELSNDLETVRQKIVQLIPALHDIDLTTKAVAHSLEGTKARIFTDFNERHIKNLSTEDIDKINSELEQVPKVLEYFGYAMLPTRKG